MNFLLKKKRLVYNFYRVGSQELDLPDGSLYLINGLNMLPAFSIAVANLQWVDSIANLEDLIFFHTKAKSNDPCCYCYLFLKF